MRISRAFLPQWIVWVKVKNCMSEMKLWSLTSDFCSQVFSQRVRVPRNASWALFNVQRFFTKVVGWESCGWIWSLSQSCLFILSMIQNETHSASHWSTFPRHVKKRPYVRSAFISCMLYYIIALLWYEMIDQYTDLATNVLNTRNALTSTKAPSEKASSLTPGRKHSHEGAQGSRMGSHICAKSCASHSNIQRPWYLQVLFRL